MLKNAVFYLKKVSFWVIFVTVITRPSTQLSANLARIELVELELNSNSAEGAIWVIELAQMTPKSSFELLS